MTTTILVIVATIILVVASLYIFAYIVFYGAKHKVFGTFPQNGTIEIVGAGSDENGNVADYIRTIPNVTDYKLAKSAKMTVKYWTEVKSKTPPDDDNPDSRSYDLSSPKRMTVELRDAVIPSDAEKKPETYSDVVFYSDEELTSGFEKRLVWLFKLLKFMGKNDLTSFRWVSLFYFWKRVGSFRILKSKVKEYEKTKDVVLRDTVETHEEIVDNIVWKSQRPILVRSLELNDRSECDLRLTVILVFLMPRILAFIYKHRFYAAIDSAIEGAVRDFCRKRSYSQLVSYIKSGPSSDFFKRALSELNAQGGGESGEGFVQGFGVLLVNGWMDDIELSLKDQKIREASQAKQIAEHEGNAAVVTAKKQAEVVKIQTDARVYNLQQRKMATGEYFGEELDIEKRGKTPNLGTIVERGAVDVSIGGKPPQLPP